MREYLFSVWRKAEHEIDSLNGLRAIALFMIIGHHLHAEKYLPKDPHWLHVFIRNTTSPVDLFFMLSGFLISGGLYAQWAKRQDLGFKTYFMRRSLRIFPAYYFFIGFVILGVLGVLASGKALPAEGRQFTENVLSNWWVDVFYVSNFFQPRLVMHGWTLSIEEQFYTIFPFFAYFILFRLSRGKRMLLLLGLYFLPLIFRFLHAYITPADLLDPYGRIYEFSYTRADCILTGIMAMEIYFCWREYFERAVSGVSGWVIAGVSVVCLVVAHAIDMKVHPVYFHTLRFNLLNIGWLGTMLLALKPTTLTARFFAIGIFTGPARLAYSMYLWHLIAGAAGVKVLLPSTFKSMSWLEYFGSWVLSYLILLFVGWMLFLIVEKPFMTLKDVLSGKSVDLRKAATSGEGPHPSASSLASPDLANRGNRFAAIMIDYYLWLPCLFLAGVIKLFPSHVDPIWRSVILALAVAYGIGLACMHLRSIYRRGASLGLAWMRLTVVDGQGSKVDVWRYVLLRTLLGNALLASLAFIPVNAFLFLRPSARTIGDRLSGGRVVVRDLVASNSPT